MRDHLAHRTAQVSAEVIQQLKDEGIYPYPEGAATRLQEVERQTFDVVVTCARYALPDKLPARQLSVNLIHSALETSPGDLHKILDKVLALNDDDRRHLANLLDSTDLSHVIGAATTVTNRLNFIGAMRKFLADPALRRGLREVDQLHPMISENLWLFGEDWTLARTEVGLTNVLQAHLSELGSDVVLETHLQRVPQPDGRAGRVDILLFRGRRSDNTTERIVVELKRPTVRVGRKELNQIRDYARAIVDNPQYRGVDCSWRFYLITYEYDESILRDIRQKDKPAGLADDQAEYQVWVKSWGEILAAAEQKLRFFQEQLDYEATDERVVAHLRDTYAHFLPDGMPEPGEVRLETAPES